MDSTSNTDAALHNMGQGFASLAKAVYLFLVVIPTAGANAHGRRIIGYFALASAWAFWAGYDRTDAVALVSTTKDAWRPESWIVIMTGAVIWLAWRVAQQFLSQLPPREPRY